MNRRTMLIGGVAVAALVALLAWAFPPRPVEVEVAEATMGPFETTVDEDARTRVADQCLMPAMQAVEGTDANHAALRAKRFALDVTEQPTHRPQV